MFHFRTPAYGDSYLTSGSYREINIHGDGRCFFRAVVSVLDKDLLRATRSGGLICAKKLQEHEEACADSLRQKVVEMLECEKGLEMQNLNCFLDRGINRSFTSLSERLHFMRNPYEFVGFLEVLATCYILKRKIRIFEPHETSFKLMATLPTACSCYLDEPITLAYRAETVRSPGHYSILDVLRSADDVETCYQQLCHPNQTPSFVQLLCSQTGAGNTAHVQESVQESGHCTDYDGRTEQSSAQPGLPVSANSVHETPTDLGTYDTGPHRPNLPVFPQTVFGKAKRMFHRQWFEQFPWLEYSVQADAAFCFSCRQDPSQSARSCGDKLVGSGYRNWKRAVQSFHEHESSQSHLSSMTAWACFQSTQKTGTVEHSIKKGEEKCIADRRRYLTRLIEVTRFLARQGLAFRAHDESKSSRNKGNFVEALHLLQKFDPFLQQYKAPENATYISPSSVNCLIECCASVVLNVISNEIQDAGVFAVMADEARDARSKEQLATCVRFVTKDGYIKEAFIGLSEMQQFDAKSIILCYAIRARKSLKLKTSLAHLEHCMVSSVHQSYSITIFWMHNSS